MSTRVIKHENVSRNQEIKIKVLGISSFIILCLAFSFTAYGEEKSVNELPAVKVAETASMTAEKTSAQESGVVTALLGDKEEISKIEQKADETKEAIDKQLETVEVAKKEVEKVVEEKKVLEKETELKAHAADIVKKELEITKKAATVTGDKKTVEKLRELEQKSYDLEKQAQLSKEKLALAGDKSTLAQETVEKSKLRIETLNKELEDLKRERNMRQGWIPKLSVEAAIITVGFLLMFLLNWGLRKFSQAISDKDAIREKEATLRLKTLLSVFRWTGSVVIVAVIIYMVLDNVGINMAPILAAAGVAGIAVGFGGQYLIRDIINGIFILVEGQYRINDVVKIGDLGGLVEAVNLRHTRLRDLEGRVIYIPNGKVESVINYTQEYSQALLDIGVAYKENVDQVMEVLGDIAEEMRKDPYYGRLILDKLEMLGVDEFADSQVTIKCRMMTLPIKQWEVAREFRRRIKNKFDELDIEIPFPHRTIYQGKDKDLSKLEIWREQRKGKKSPEMKRSHVGETS